MTNPFALASKAKGRSALIKRARSITERYGLTSSLMDQSLHQLSIILLQFDCGATLPITAVTLKRHRDIVKKYLDLNIEFAVHGYTHVDYTQLAPEEQLAHLRQSQEVFTNMGIKPKGFRSPYLSQNDNLYTAIEAAGFSYVSNQPFLWDVLPKDNFAPAKITNYERAMAFYNPWLAGCRVSLPQQVNQLVEIPVSLPDDEILIERLDGTNGLVKKTWLRILSQTYQRGELFTLQLHPERTSLCADGLTAVLKEARALLPAVWCARLDEIANWWRMRDETYLHTTKIGDSKYKCIVSGPLGTTLLVRSVETDVQSQPWADGYREVKTARFTCYSSRRPFIGISPSTSIDLTKFLRQQGFIIEISQEPELFSYYIDQGRFTHNDECSILAAIEDSGCPLIRFGCWPNGAKSALAITGDIDALTLWDYGMRLIGK